MIFSSTPKDGSEIHRFSNKEVHCWKFMNIRGIPKSNGKFRTLFSSNVKYNFAILFLRQIYWLFIYTSKYIFSQATFVKPGQNFLI